jgi:hypothetical protein
MTALFGMLIAVSSFIIDPLLERFVTGPEPNAPYMFPALHDSQLALWNGVYAGVLLAIASAIVRAMPVHSREKGSESLCLKM